MHRRVFAAGAVSLLAAPAIVKAAPPPLIVAELFTSQGCSSCPPADMLLTELADTAPNVLPLAFHVTYWDRLGWRDPFSLEAATERQKYYSALWRADEIYTPQLIVAGRKGVVGSDRAAVSQTLAAASALDTYPIHVRRDGATAVINIPAGGGAAAIVLVGYDSRHRTAIGRGENGGRTLIESNIVRGLDQAGRWDGPAIQIRRPAPAGERLAVLMQAQDGAIVGAAREG